MKKQFYTYVILLLFASVVFSSCNLLHSGDITLKSSDTIKLAVYITYKTEQFTLKFDSVLSDSRCPLMAECIWAGNAEIRLKLNVNNENHTFTLNTLPGYRQDTTLRGINISLLELNPYPENFDPIEYSAYKAKLLIK